MFNIPPVVLAAIIVLGLVHALFVLGLDQDETNDLVLTFAFIPARYDLSVLHSLDWIVGWGAAVWSFLTYAFLHADLNHLILNLVWLLAFGTPVARRFGPMRFLGFLAVTAIAGAALHLATHFGERLPMIGASAAICGAMAAAMRFAFQRGGPLGLLRSEDADAYRVPAAPLGAILREPRVLVFLLAWLGFNVLFGLGPISMPGVEQSVAWQAHIGGFAAGLFAFKMFDPVDACAAPAEQPEVDTTLP